MKENYIAYLTGVINTYNLIIQQWKNAPLNEITHLANARDGFVAALDFIEEEEPKTMEELDMENDIEYLKETIIGYKEYVEDLEEVIRIANKNTTNRNNMLFGRG